VVDQFAIPALGGVGIEALALGRRLITRVDEPTLADFFGACPPVLNAATVAEVERAMRGVLDDPADHRGLGTAGRVWIETYHSAARIMALQLGAYRDLVGTAADRAHARAPRPRDTRPAPGGGRARRDPRSRPGL
jgi:hypothetical protein